MKQKIYISAILLLALVLATGCEMLGDFEDTNVNPVTTSSPPTSALLTNALSGIGKYSDSYPDFENWAALYCQYFSETYATDNSRYAIYARSPMDLYSSELYDLQSIININSNDDTKDKAAEEGANDNQIAIARILKAYIYWTITDRWGDIPYSNALTGDPNVHYDRQEEIYMDLISELTESIAQFTTGNPVKGDFVYNGDIVKWKKFANSLRMLMSVRLSKRFPSPSDYAALQFNAALESNAGSMESNDDNFKLNFEGGHFKNPYFDMYDAGEYTGESEAMTDLLQFLNNDQRQTVFGADASGEASTLGVPYGLITTDIQQWCSDNPTWCHIFHPDFREPTDPVYIITASQIYLARAEAADRGWTTETPNTAILYQEGITQSYLQWGLDAPDDTYFNSINVALPETPGTGANLEQIAAQQYVSFYPDGTQGWSNWRRTNYPTLYPAPDAVNSPKVIPRRYMYGSSDYELTEEGVEEAVARMPGGDRMDSRVWWDKE
jgi:hypothetical protein